MVSAIDARCGALTEDIVLFSWVRGKIYDLFRQRAQLGTNFMQSLLWYLFSSFFLEVVSMR